MSWLNDLQNRSREQKIRLIQISAGVVVVLLIVVWVVASQFHKNVNKDTTLFDQIGSGINNVKNNFKK